MAQVTAQPCRFTVQNAVVVTCGRVSLAHTSAEIGMWLCQDARLAAANYVITPQNIRRYGVTNIPDLLRMVSDMDVAQVTANGWALSCRGFSDLLANKLLVMIDGRSVYDSAFAGVFWDLQDVPLEDMERIEVIVYGEIRWRF